MPEYVNSLLHKWLNKLGFTETYSFIIVATLEFLLLLAACYIAYLVARYIIHNMVHALAKKTKSQWADVFIKRKFFIRTAYFVPLLLISFFAPLIFSDYPFSIQIIKAGTQIFILAAGISVFNAFLNGFLDIYQSFSFAKSRPIKGYIQVVRIIAYILATVVLISIFLGKNGFAWLAGFGAFSAVLMLIFKDPILGFVGSIQLTSNNMVHIGDWISMPKYGADGNVIDITLTTVKVQNWDKTITTIPTYTMVTDYFQNWRGMEESGGRRIKRSVNIDMNSIQFCTPKMLEDFKKIHYLKEYIAKKETELAAYNKKYNVDDTILVNGRRQTNIGVFRAYLKEYLKNLPAINSSMTQMVRQLQPTENGIPVEIYVFSKVQEWAAYEDVQSDIFDHILAVIPLFKLRVFQQPTGSDFMKLKG